jgi:GntR family transcriptional regulator, transcriptional repressor for pyruvate dehydrogenase complex
MKNKEQQDLPELIRVHIVKNSSGPGSRIETEEQLAKRFNVTRYHIRNVLNSLAQQGIITKTPRKGTFINKIDTDAILNNLKFSYQVSNFNLYESIEARIVIELSTLPLVLKRITPSDIVNLEGCIKKMLINKNEPCIADAADLEFHAILLQASGNQLLNSFSKIITQLFHQVDYRQQYWNTETIERLAFEHRSILEAIQDDDLELATIRLKSHLNYKKRIELDEMRRNQASELKES